ncbi:hypothetical protein ABZ250_08560 [Streptomyces afghaniensis]|uniref:hypothetical protein n=1 Tax=Streptomyces afghaniensis TaxID=66865 RepID=UPI0033A46703
MARSRSRRRRNRRSSISCYLRDIVEATEDFVDDVLDDADEFECDIRHSLSKALDDDCDDCDDCDDDDDDDCRDRDRDRGRDRDRDRDRDRGRDRDPDRDRVRDPVSHERERDRREVAELRAELADLKDKIARMAPEQR